MGKRFRICSRIGVDNEEYFVVQKKSWLGWRYLVSRETGQETKLEKLLGPQDVAFRTLDDARMALRKHEGNALQEVVVEAIDLP